MLSFLIEERAEDCLTTALNKVSSNISTIMTKNDRIVWLNSKAGARV